MSRSLLDRLRALPAKAGTPCRAQERLAKNPGFVAHLEAVGRERALIYKTLVLTGLRKSELASLTLAQLDLDSSPPYLVLKAADEKNREGSTIFVSG
jgi:integrase